MVNSKYKIVLASGSPRRKQLLSGLGLHFEVRLLPGIDESYPDGLPPEDIAKTISRKKAHAYRATLAPDTLLITADTIVCLGGQVLGKPRDDQDARRMLRLLSGKTHHVVTAVTLLTQGREETFASTTAVTFADISDEEIAYYVEHFRPLDKAGAYGIQEWIGHIGVERIEGSYFNVMGLPVARLYQTLKKYL